MRKDLAYAVAQLNQNAVAIQGLVTVSVELARWKPAPAEWSILEVLGHLADEEREDFRRRVDYTLNRPGEAWPAIHPGAWVTERRYNEQDPDQTLADFLTERGASLAWLRQQADADWSRSYDHPAGVTLTATDLLAAWLAHDGLHLRQLVELHRAYLHVVWPGADIGYAGDW